MEKFKVYDEKKQNLLKRFNLLMDKMLQLDKIGVDFKDKIGVEFPIDCSESKNKITQAIKILEGDKISIAFVGAFSDGKTSIIAGWLNELKDDMKIASDESSDKIQPYKSEKLPKNCIILDTPGLFGSKEETDEKGNLRKLGEKTKKFIDAANIIIYVVDAKNPIKNSHIESLSWILKDLNKISNVIFVINKMDYVADLTDEDEFNCMAEKKKNDVRKKLKEMLELNDSDVEKIKIVCISSNPGNKGFNYWSKYSDEYDKRSHIFDLEKATNEILKENTISSLINKTGNDILLRLLHENLNQVSGMIDVLKKYFIPNSKESAVRDKKNLQDATKRILQIKPQYWEAVRDYEAEMYTKINGLSMDNVKNFLDVEIGLDGQNTGYRFEDKLNIISEQYFKQIASQVNRVKDQFFYENNKQVELLDIIEDKIGGELTTVFKNLPKGKLIEPLKGAIFGARDIIKNLGVVIKFKPWQVTKFATFIDKSVPIVASVVDVGIDIINTWRLEKKQKEFNEFKHELINMLKKVFLNIYATLRDDSLFISTYVPQLNDLSQIAQKCEKKSNDIEQKYGALDIWKKDTIKIMDAEFTDIK